MLSTYLGNDKPGPRDTTLGVDLGTQTMLRRNSVLKINVWDTTGDDNFRGLIAIYCRNTDAFVIVFDVTSRQSFWNAHTWAIFLVEHCADEGVPPMCLVGNKADRVVRVSLSLQCAACMSLCSFRLQQEVTEQEGHQVAGELGIPYFETSALDGNGVQELFETMVERAVKVVTLTQVRENECTCCCIS